MHANPIARLRTWLRCRTREEAGVSLIELALVLPLLVLLLVGSVDLGRGFFVANEIAGAASAGAAYGVQNPADVGGIQSAAMADAADLHGVTVLVTTGCENAGSSSSTTSCDSTGGDVVRFVQVNTYVTYKLVLPFPGVTSLPLSGSARMRVRD